MIDKLSIEGIRSFDPVRAETIQFYAPLTLIVGYNGSGKTTIIECLKYITTGDLPPNSKGGAFIHDPQLCGEKEIYAQVKLLFKGAGPQKFVATRSLLLTQKKNARSQKTLEGQLHMVKNAERYSISKRVAELDKMIPRYLGVSKAMLDNVIFCHQDESLWPMSEPGVLKKKFDEIFEVTKYTKAIEEMKIQRKNHNQELGKLKIHEQHAKEEKERGEKNVDRSRHLQKEIEQLRDRIKSIDVDVKKAGREAQDAFDRAGEFTAVIGELSGKRIQEKSKEETIYDLAQHMRKMTEADEDLKEMLDQYEGNLQSYESNVKLQTEKYHSLSSQIENGRTRLGKKQSEHGKYEAEKDQYERQLESRETLIKDTARRHEIRGFDYDLDDAKIQEFMDRINRMARDQNSALERARRDAQEERQKAQDTLSSQTERRSTLNQRKEYAKNQVSTNDKKIDNLRVELNNNGVNEGRKATLQSRSEEVEKKLQSSKDDFVSSKWDNKVKEVEAEMIKYEETAEELSKELHEATKHAADTAQLDFVKKSLSENERSLETMKGAHGNKISHYISEDWQPSSLETEYHDILTKSDETVKEAELQRSNLNRDLEQADYKFNGNRTELKAKEDERQKLAKTIHEVTEEDDPNQYPKVLEESEKYRESVKENADGFENMRDWWSKCSSTLEKKGVCRLCERPFQSDKERSTFQSKIKKYVSEAAQEKLQVELKAADDDLKGLREIGWAYETWKRLDQIDIPKLRQEAEKLGPEKDSMLRRAEDLDERVRQKQSAKRDIELLSKTVQQIVKYYNETVSLRANIDALSAKQSQSGRSRGIDEIQNLLTASKEKAKVVKINHQSAVHGRDRAKENISQLELEIRDVRVELSAVDQKLADRNRTMSQIEELTKFNEGQNSSIEDVNKDLDKLAPQISQSQAKLEDINARARAKENELHAQASKMSESAQHVKMADRDINAYLDKNGPKQLERSTREMQNLAEEISDLEKEQKKVTTEINKLREQQKNHEGIKTDIIRNLRYRENLRDLEVIRKEISELEARNAEVDRDEYLARAQSLQLHRNKLSADQATMMGETKSKDAELARLIEDYKELYDGAPFRYKMAHIKVEVTKAVIEDIGRFGGAMDKAIMHWHSLRMETINQIIEELWRSTYRGSDIDTVLIKSDNENTKGNKSYNYRVCMVKQDAEMDMRGRCSAGQKVLASIIIRLALAYTFGNNCGFIALDEPTTNLDSDNIQSLAKSLHDLIKDRQKQHNFQLIVITHDEEFLRHMQAQDFCDNYYRVSRNSRQKSIIERQSIDGMID